MIGAAELGVRSLNNLNSTLKENSTFMEPFTIFSLASAAIQNRNKFVQTLKWFQGDKDAFETNEQKIEKLKGVVEELIEAQQLQDEWMINIPKVFIRLWIALGVSLAISAISLGLAIYLLSTSTQ